MKYLSGMGAHDIRFLSGDGLPNPSRLLIGTPDRDFLTMPDPESTRLSESPFTLEPILQ